MVIFAAKNMILDSVKSFEKYKTLVPGFDKVYDFLRNNKLQELAEGKHEIDGKNVYCTIFYGDLKGIENCPLEVHDSYIDIHVIIEGIETIGIKDRCLCDDQSANVKYKEEEDIAFLNDDTPDSYVSIGANNLAIIFPADAHAPLMGEGTIKKAVFKVMVERPKESFLNN